VALRDARGSEGGREGKSRKFNSEAAAYRGEGEGEGIGRKRAGKRCHPVNAFVSRRKAREERGGQTEAGSTATAVGRGACTGGKGRSSQSACPSRTLCLPLLCLPSPSPVPHPLLSFCFLFFSTAISDGPGADRQKARGSKGAHRKHEQRGDTRKPRGNRARRAAAHAGSQRKTDPPLPAFPCPPFALFVPCCLSIWVRQQRACRPQVSCFCWSLSAFVHT
jgi:hypothetical protein